MRSGRLLRIGALVVVVVGILVYAGFEARGILRGPVIVVESPTNGETLSDRIVMFQGTTERISRITLNGRPILISQEGRFEEPLALSPGYNKTLIEGWDRFDSHVAFTIENYFIPSWYHETNLTR